MGADEEKPHLATDADGLRAAAMFLSDGLAGIPARLAAIEEATGRLAAGECAAGLVVTLQDLDRLRQETEDLARFATELCEALPDPGDMAVLVAGLGRALRLVELQERFAGLAFGGPGSALNGLGEDGTATAVEPGEYLSFDRPRRAV